MSRAKVSPEIQLKRFLYLSNEQAKYITGNPELHGCYKPQRMPAVDELLKSQTPDRILNIIEVANSENALPRRETIFCVLAFILRTNTELPSDFRRKVVETTLNLLKSSEDLCLFIKFCSLHHKTFSSSINKLISAYYLKQDPLTLCKEISHSIGHHGWKHKDLLKLSHCKSDSIIITIIVTHVLFGFKKAVAMAEDNPDATEVIAYLSTMEELRHCEEESRIAEIVSQFHCQLRQVPSYFHKSRVVWEAVIPELPLPELVGYLPRFYKLGFLKGSNPLQNKVVEHINDLTKIKASKIHPVEIFIALKNFEKGGKPMDEKLKKHLAKQSDKTRQDKKPIEAPKCPSVVAALGKALQASYQNLQSTGRRMMITIDVSEKMDGDCMGSKNVSCIEAAAILTLSWLKTEREVTIAVFNDMKVSLVNADRGLSINQLILKLRQLKHGFVLPSSPVEWASNKKKHVDVFVNFLCYPYWRQQLAEAIEEKERPIEALTRYRKKMALPHTKLITLSPASPHLSLTDDSPNVLDICGFDKEVPKVVEAFSRGFFC